MNSLVALFTLLLATSTFTSPVPKNIMDLLLQARQDRVSVIVQAIQAAGLADTLRGDGPFMLFAPVNDAFKALPEGTVGKLIAAPADLKKLLLGHVVKGNTPVGELKTGDLTSVDGKILKVAVNAADKTVTVDNAKIIVPMNMSAVTASNGVIHFIDRVLLTA